MDENKNIADAVNAAFVAETQGAQQNPESKGESPDKGNGGQSTESSAQSSDDDKENQNPSEAQDARDKLNQMESEAKSDDDKENQKSEVVNQKSDDDIPAPQQLKGDFVKSHWKDADKETKDELIRLASENERNFKRAAEAEYNNRNFRKTLQSVQGYISEVAQTDNIPEADVIRNCVAIVQNLNDNPTLTARQMIAGRVIQFDDPVAVINEIAHTYGLDLKGELQERGIPQNYANAAARAKYEARQAKYASADNTDAEREAMINEYVDNSPSIKALLENPQIKDRFVRQIQMERAADASATDIAIINRAAELFQGAVARAQPTDNDAESQKARVINQKLNKVVAPKASNPTENAPAAPDEWTPDNVSVKSRKAAEDSVRAAMRSMGLDA